MTAEQAEQAGTPGESVAPDIVPLRRNRDFLLLWTGSGFSQLGSRMSVMAFPLVLIWGLGSPAGAGVVAFAGLLPALVLQLPAGVLIDRWDRRKLMIACDAVAAIAMISVVVALVLGVVWLPHLAVAAFLEGTCMIFYLPAERAAIRNVVAPEQISAAISQNEARGRAAGLLGQPAGSSLFALVSWLPFAAVAFGHVVALTNLGFVRSKLQTERVRRPVNLRREVVEGVRWLWDQKFLRAATTLVALTNFVAQIVTMASILLVRDLGGSAALTGLVGTVGGVGGVCGALAGAVLLRKLSLGGVLLVDIAARAVLIPLMAFTPSLLLLFVPFAVMSFTGAVLNVGAGSYMATIVPDELHGRAMSAILLMSWGMNSAGALAGGLLLTWFTPASTLTAIGAVLVVTLVGAALNPTIRGARAR
ncbi:MFS transporter [Labedaea rhizosphaerae]|uniref:Putative MFS family arabinose efflux permease n=1 Tax=Labedaea rhizosphaerae TaxID=598644 RepID=A0A4R6SI01_LABRH|nr:MFS transporter [Labedaea rhizosphaerae]TDQ00499.1 putative MFS family arabinose efflux permease [Labedaea rhizosphaerae]